MQMIGERLYALRKEAGLTQDELAELLQINKHSISSYERDKRDPPDPVKVRIARYFHVSVDYLLKMTDNPRPVDSEERVLRLPHDFPIEALAELTDFMEFLIEKARRDPSAR